MILQFGLGGDHDDEEKDEDDEEEELKMKVAHMASLLGQGGYRASTMELMILVLIMSHDHDDAEEEEEDANEYLMIAHWSLYPVIARTASNTHSSKNKRLSDCMATKDLRFLTFKY